MLGYDNSPSDVRALLDGFAYSLDIEPRGAQEVLFEQEVDGQLVLVARDLAFVCVSITSQVPRASLVANARIQCEAAEGTTPGWVTVSAAIETSSGRWVAITYDSAGKLQRAEAITDTGTFPSSDPGRTFLLVEARGSELQRLNVWAEGRQGGPDGVWLQLGPF